MTCSGKAEQLQATDPLRSFLTDEGQSSAFRELLKDIPRSLEQEWDEGSLWSLSAQELEKGPTAAFGQKVEEIRKTLERSYGVSTGFLGCKFEPVPEGYIKPTIG